MKITNLARTFILLTLALSVVLVSGCASATKIADVKANPAQFQGKEVTIKGTVGGSFWVALLTKGAYELTDETGNIWVVCSQSPPEKNSLVEVKGTVEKALTVGERSLGTVVIETDRGNL